MNELEAAVNPRAREPVRALHVLVYRLKRYDEMGNASGMCEIIRHEGLAQFKKLASLVTNPLVRKPILDIVRVQTQVAKTLNRNCNFQIIQALLKFVASKVAEAVRNKKQEDIGRSYLNTLQNCL